MCFPIASFKFVSSFSPHCCSSYCRKHCTQNRDHSTIIPVIFLHICLSLLFPKSPSAFPFSFTLSVYLSPFSHSLPLSPSCTLFLLLSLSIYPSISHCFSHPHSLSTNMFLFLSLVPSTLFYHGFHSFLSIIVPASSSSGAYREVPRRSTTERRRRDSVAALKSRHLLARWARAASRWIRESRCQVIDTSDCLRVRQGSCVLCLRILRPRDVATLFMIYFTTFVECRDLL